MIGADWFGGLAQNLITSALFLAAGFVVGLWRERKRLEGRALTEYDFYPYTATAERFAEFSLKDFRLGMHNFLRNRDTRAARQLIFIGDQNDARQHLSEADKATYESCAPNITQHPPSLMTARSSSRTTATSRG